MKLFLKITKCISIILFLGLLLIAMFVLLTKANSVDAFSMGDYKPLNVLGGSMEPTIKVGSVVLVKKANVENIKIGDIITYRPPRALGENKAHGSLTTHRVTKIAKKKDQIYFETKGDANKTVDSNLVYAERVLGRVVLSVPYLASLGFYIKGPIGFLFFIIIPGLLVITIEVCNIFHNLKNLKNENSA